MPFFIVLDADSLVHRVSQVWGTSVKHSRGQKVGLDHVLNDEDVVRLVKKI